MGAEIGATTSMFPFNSRMADFLNSTKRSDVANYATKFQHNLRADKGADYDQVISIVRFPAFMSAELVFMDLHLRT